MWICTLNGFYSIVKDMRAEGSLLVRARAREHLEAFCTEASVRSSSIIETPDADYPYRIAVARVVVMAWVTKQTQQLDYTNFKSAVETGEPSMLRRWYAEALHSVWSTMRRQLDPRMDPRSPRSHRDGPHRR